MRGRVIIGFAMLALAVGFGLMWFKAPSIVAHMRTVTAAVFTECDDKLDEACGVTFSQLGQTGDLFGAVSSLFSGLALFAVACTLWLDSSGRRHSRKPIVVCKVSDEKPIQFNDPSTSSPRAVRVSLDLLASSINDVAMNISIRASLKGKNWEKHFAPATVPVPLVNDGKEGLTMPLELRLDAHDIRQIATTLKTEETVSLHLRSSFQSLESVTWHTETEFDLRFRPTDVDRMTSLNEDGDRCIAIWANQVAVQVDVTSKTGSWRHYK